MEEAANKEMLSMQEDLVNQLGKCEEEEREVGRGNGERHIACPLVPMYASVSVSLCVCASVPLCLCVSQSLSLCVFESLCL